MKKISIIVIALLACAACAKKPNNTSETAKAPQGTVTEKPAADSTSKRDMSGMWEVSEGGRTWELVIKSSGANTWTTTPTLLSNPDKNDMIYGKPGDKGDTLIIVSDEPGKFRVRYAEAKNFHNA
jgi:hypothetical protein